MIGYFIEIYKKSGVGMNVDKRYVIVLGGEESSRKDQYMKIV